ncbi:MAG: glycosyltransferase family 1 protein [bacterium]|jgi:glycosyltransferase involved in cell wall biosynthesis|nr:glycosyltransferase family 1 protein [bacterium]
MRIGIDARMFGPSVGGGGLGRYVEQLIGELAQQKNKNRYVLFVKTQEQANQIPNDERFEIRVTNTHWYTLKEQLRIPKLIDQEHLDLMHFPHWNIPLGVKTPFVVTIHDLILLEEPRSAKVTTRHPWVYAAKYRAYKHVLKSAIVRANKIIAVSEYTKSAIQKHFPNTDAEKVTVVHEGLTQLSADKNKPEALIDGTYLLYVGNAYPHKNLESLLHAFSFFHKLHPEVKLVLAGRNDVFYQRLKQELDEIDVDEQAVRFIMSPTDAELANLYQNATLYLFPSRSEGFGLPPLEAMSFGVPVAAARRTSLPEILGDAALYFEPDDIEEMVRIMEQVLGDKKLQKELSFKGAKQIKRYSWKTMAAHIQTIYQDCAK